MGMQSDVGRIIDALPGLVWTALPDGRPDFLNRRWYEYTGLSADEAIPDGWQGSVHPDDLAQLLRYWSALVSGSDAGEVEARLRRHDGVYRWFAFRGAPVKDAEGRVLKWCGINTDVEELKRTEERKRSEEALKASERDLKLAIDTTPAMIWTTDAQGRAETFNQHYFDYVGGLPPEQLEGWGWAQIVHPDDMEALAASWAAILARGEPGVAEARMRRQDGVYHWFLIRANPLRDANGKIVKWYGVNFDIEDRKRADEAVVVSERNLKVAVDTTPAMIWTTTAGGATETVNQHYFDYVGLPLAEILGWKWTQIVHPDDLDRLTADWGEILARGEPGEAEARMRRYDGTYRWFLIRANPLRDSQGKISKWYGVNFDIETQKRAEQALAASERNLRETIDTVPTFSWCNRLDGSNEFLSKRWHDYTGLTPEQANGWGWQVALHPDDLPMLLGIWREMLATGRSGELEARLRRHDGVYRWFLFRCDPFLDENGNILKWYGTNTDIEDLKQAESELRRAYGHLTEAQRLSKTGSFTADTHHDEHVWSPELYRIFEVDPATEIKIQLIRDRAHPDDLATLDAGLQRGIDGLNDVDFVIRLILPSGAQKHVHIVAHRIEQIAERPVYFGAIQDITEARLSEDALRRSEAFLAQGEAVSETGSFLWHLDSSEIIRWSDQLYRIFEFAPGAPVTIGLINERVHPEDRHLAADMVARARAGGPSEYEHRLLMPDGRVKHLHFVGQPLRDEEGRQAYMGSLQDVTERRVSEQVLSKVRSELAHVARVSSLGALTASIAHEVNQPLAGIVTNASTCLRMLAADPPNIDGARETARRTIRDGNRASEVIKRLRALFAKKEASLEALDLNQAAQEVLALSVNELQRSRVILRHEFAEDLPHVSGDRVQLQQVILNLILNAVDAMNDVHDRQRQLVIRTKIDEDDQVRVEVQDSGAGIKEQDTQKLFDAFYTTKPNGMGIGLSVSRSIIERHQGRLWARANDGRGATFSFAIPRLGNGAVEVIGQG